MRSERTSCSGLPATTSTTRPRTSVDRLYSHCAPGWLEQGRLRQLGNELVHGQRQRGFVGRLRIHLVDLALAAVAVSQPRGVAHQILDRHLAGGGGSFEADRPSFERGDVLRHWIRKKQPAF